MVSWAGREWQDQCAAQPAGIVESGQVSQKVACVTKCDLNPDQSPTTGHRSPTGQTSDLRVGYLQDYRGGWYLIGAGMV